LFVTEIEILSVEGCGKRKVVVPDMSAPAASIPNLSTSSGQALATNERMRHEKGPLAFGPGQDYCIYRLAMTRC
jgi:hypothetical protein